MLNGRLYRAAAVPLVVVVAVLALSPTNRPAALSPALAPVAFDGAWTSQELAALAREFPERAPGSRGDDLLAGRIAQTIQALGGSGGGFRVGMHRFDGRTNDGQRSLVTVVAQRAGSTSASPVVVVAHRDAGSTGAEAELSASAALLELARVFTNQQTRRTIVLVSTSGGSGGDAGAQQVAGLLRSGQTPWGGGAATAPAPEGAEREGGPSGEALGQTGGAGAAAASRPVDAVLVLGDLASQALRQPLVLPYSSGLGEAPPQLVDTASNAIQGQALLKPGGPDIADQLAHLSLPVTLGEEGVFNAQDLPSIMIQASGETGPSSREPVSSGRMEGLGNAVLGTIDALDAGPDIASGPQAVLLVAHKVIPGWAVRLLVAALLFPALLVTIDAVARARRQRQRLRPALAFVLACALPFGVCMVFLAALDGLGLLGATPGLQAAGGATAVHGFTVAAIVLTILLFALAWLYWPRVLRSLGVADQAGTAAAGVCLLAVLDATALVLWLANPFAALLLVPAAHLWMLVAAPELRPRRRWVGMAIVLLGLCGPLLVAVYYAHQLSIGALGGAWALVLLPVGAHMGLGTELLWSLSLGCLVAAALAALRPRRAEPVRAEPVAITIRGPLTYAGPGSIGGTESALRR
jgi:hypothetical protein